MSPTGCGVSERDREALIMRRPTPTKGCCATKKKLNKIYITPQLLLQMPSHAANQEIPHHLLNIIVHTTTQDFNMISNPQPD